MKLGEKAELCVKSEYAYGEDGSSCVPGDTNVRFIIHLL